MGNKQNSYNLEYEIFRVLLLYGYEHIRRFSNLPKTSTIEEVEITSKPFDFQTLSLKGALSGLKQFSATEIPLKMMKNVF